MITVEVRNFQSIEHVSLRLNGYTALVGRSNIGKSAVVRAMQYALTNALGTEFVRHERSTCARFQKNAKSCKCMTSVHITGEGFDLLWQKGDSDNKYTFNGTVYDKPGVGLPSFLADNGLAPIKVSGESKSIQVADQFFPIFLLDQSGPAVAEAISDVARLDKVSAATKMVDKDRREAVSTKKVREKDVLGLEAKLATYDGLDAASSRVDRAEQALSQIDALEARMAALGKYVLVTGTTVKELQELTVLSKAKVPGAEDMRHLSERVRLQKRAAYLIDAIGTLEPLSDVVIPEPPDASKVRQLDGWIGKLQSFKNAFEKMSRVEKVVLPEMGSCAEQRKKLVELATYASKLLGAQAAHQKLEMELQQLLEEEKQLKADADALGVCPTCSQAVGRHDHA